MSNSVAVQQAMHPIMSNLTEGLGHDLGRSYVEYNTWDIEQVRSAIRMDSDYHYTVEVIHPEVIDF